ncbi:methylmalonyl-CoA mutase family protein [Myroides sp. DW712]|uniref:methylmalonyl-CoA mutase family protein n=1 Tax=Myroides sp. DW712 TaxID=3389800 RepID=UPI00397D3E00
MKRKDLQHLKWDASSFPTPSTAIVGTTPTGTPNQQHYTEEDIECLEEIDFAAGFAPFVRGISPLMYVQQPWKIQHALQNNTLEEANSFYHTQIERGQKDLFFDFHSSKSQQESSHIKRFAIQSVEEMKLLLHQLPLGDVIATIRTDEAFLPLLALYLVAAEEEGIPMKLLRGNLQYDSFGFVPAHAAILQRAIHDSLVYVSQYAPHFQVLSLSNQQLKKANCTADQEIAYTVMQGLTYVSAGRKAQIPVDYTATHLAVIWQMGLNPLMEIAKMRAIRLVWARTLHAFEPKNEQALALHLHAQLPTKEENEKEDLTTATIASTAAIFGGAQTLVVGQNAVIQTAYTVEQLHTFLQKEIKGANTVDPWGGSYYLENLTFRIAEKAWEIVQQKEDTMHLSSDFLLSIQQNLNEQELQEKAKATTVSKDIPLPLQRDTQKVNTALAQLKNAVLYSNGNLLALAIDAARARATKTEIQQALLS